MSWHCNNDVLSGFDMPGSNSVIFLKGGNVYDTVVPSK